MPRIETVPPILMDQFRALHELHDERIARRVAELKKEHGLPSGVLDLEGQIPYEKQFRAYIRKMMPFLLGDSHEISCITILYLNATAAQVGEEMTDARWRVTTTARIVPRVLEPPWVLSRADWHAGKDLVDSVNGLVNEDLSSVTA